MPDTTNEQDKTTTPDQKQPDKTTPQPDTSNLASKSELDSLKEQLNKARAQERDKVRADMEAIKESKAALEQELAAIKSELQKTVRLPDPEPAPAPTVDSVQTSLSESQAEIAALRAELAKSAEREKRIEEQLTSKMESMLAASKAEAYKERALRNAKLGPLESYVVGDTIEEIQASIDKVKELKDELAKSAQEELKEQFKDFVPKAIAIDGAKKLLRETADIKGTSMGDIKRLRRMTPEERATQRKAALDKVRREHGNKFSR